ncbi:MAG: phosphoribosylanthranilate isomerase [Hyphomicrobium sp.]|nr:MAG: phosphoribosylanthranilate isomerase [Hyphomicrobium sp.]PPD01285.1 MAG: phosphoribosylanthranilate isomerase [Hyphomicrobium sp.]
MSPHSKICGISTHDALSAAISGGAEYIGLVFFAKSPRNVSLEMAASLAQAARGHTKVVALTVDADDALLASIQKSVKPDYFQLHGDESPKRVSDIKARFGLPVIKALPIETATDVAKSTSFAGIADIILFDAKAPPGADLPGGNGRAFDWSLLHGVSEKLDFMLSGGLSHDNVQDAIAQSGAVAVDVSSGVETAPGQKDTELIRRFLRAVKTGKQA